MTKFENAKMKLCAVADKVTNSKAYKAVEKGALAVGTGAVALGSMAVTACAESGVGSVVLAEINSSDVLNNAIPFINAGIPILVVVGGIRLGTRFLRGSMH